MDTYIFLTQLLTFGIMIVVFMQQAKTFNMLQGVGEHDSMTPKYPYLGTHITLMVKGVGFIQPEEDKHCRYYDIYLNGEFQITFSREELLLVQCANVYATKEMAENVHNEPDGDYTFRDAYILSLEDQEVAYELDTAHEAERLSYFLSTGTVLEPEWEW